jgi:hypothetical protein
VNHSDEIKANYMPEKSIAVIPVVINMFRLTWVTHCQPCISVTSYFFNNRYMIFFVIEKSVRLQNNVPLSERYSGKRSTSHLDIKPFDLAPDARS